MSDIPADWRNCKLAEVCTFERGLTYKKADEVTNSANTVLRANNISVESGELNFDELKHIDSAISIPPSKFVKSGTLLVCTASGSKKHLGKAAYIDQDYGYAFGGFMGLLSTNDSLLPKYLYWLTRSKHYSNFIARLSDGANINNLKFSQLAQLDVPIPPIPEQKRIVAILDEAFAGIETAIANASKNLANVRELFDSYLADNALPESAKVVRLGDCFETVTGNTPSKKDSANYGDFLPLVKPPELRGGMIQTAEDSLSRLGADKARIAPTGSVLVSCIGNLGKVAITAGPVAFNQQINAIFPRPEIMLPEFMLFQTLTDQFTQQLHEVASGTTISIVNKSKFNNLKLYAPPIEEQSAIIDRLDTILRDTQALTTLAQQKLSSLSELKQSLLQKAFSGELTADRAQEELESATA